MARYGLKMTIYQLVVFGCWPNLHVTSGTLFQNAQRWMGKNTFHFLPLNDDNMIGEH